MEGGEWLLAMGAANKPNLSQFNQMNQSLWPVQAQQICSSRRCKNGCSKQERRRSFALSWNFKPVIRLGTLLQFAQSLPAAKILQRRRWHQQLLYLNLSLHMSSPNATVRSTTARNATVKDSSSSYPSTLFKNRKRWTLSLCIF